MLGAAALGLGIGALASWLGASSELASALGVILLVVLVLSLFAAWQRRRALSAGAGGYAAGGSYAGGSFEGGYAAGGSFPRGSFAGGSGAAGSAGPMALTPSFAGSGSAGLAATPAIGPLSASTPSPSVVNAGNTPARIPPELDVAAFVAHAREQFVRLQAAYDRADLAVLREVADTEVFEELRRQIEARRGAPNLTEVQTLDAELLEVVTEPDEYVASIRFRGTVREAVGQDPVAFDEVWTLAKPRDGHSGWLLVGLQTLS
jgi:predicted lipid-binding transport protein (Tim44 family)